MLNNHSYFSFGYGTISPENLLKWAKESEHKNFVLTDINNTAAAIEFIRLAKLEFGIKPIVGVDFRKGVEQQFVALAQNNEGFAEINRFLSYHLENEVDIPEKAPDFSNVFVIYPFEKTPFQKLKPHEFVGVRPEQLLKLKFSEWRNHQDKLVILKANTFFHKKGYNTHRLLRSISENVLLSKLEAEKQATEKDVFCDETALRNLYSEFPKVIENTQNILDECTIDFEFKNYQKSHNQQVYTPNGTLQDDRLKIRQLCEEGLQFRYDGNPTKEILERLENELKVLNARGYYSYFLINWDIVNYARRKNYFYVGRGSGANSLVAYLLRITDVDPIELDLYFERFMNMSRRQPPDFDVDFSWRDRDDVTRHIFERFPKAALLGSHTTFKNRAITRELGKVLGLPPREIDKLQSRHLDINRLDKIAKTVLKYGQYIQDFPHNMTIHSSGILIPEKEIYHFTCTILPPKGFSTTHFDMYSAEDVGLYKFDILGQRGLGKIKDGVQIVKENQPNSNLKNIHNVKPFYEDKRIKHLLRNGKTMACFYVESPAMRSLLTKLRGDTYRSLVAASSIIRPGVAKSGMMAEYIKRFRDESARKYIHPKLGEILAETYGVMVYQEDVLKVAHYFAGLTLEESDILRRGMSWKFKERNEFDKVKGKFFQNCLDFGYTLETTKEVWRQIESFGNFAFAKGHSASYAVESYQSLYLKAYFPLEYMVATINNGGGFYRVETYVNEARLHGGDIQAPCVNRSNIETCIDGIQIFLGFNLMKELEDKVVGRILKERKNQGEFQNFQHFLDRVEISLEQLIILIRIGAFRLFNPDKKKLLWEAHFRLGGSKKSKPVNDLFRSPPKEVRLPELEHEANEDAYDEMEILGFPLSSPFHLIESIPKNTILAKDFPEKVNKNVTMAGYLIHIKNLNTRQKQSRFMQFGTFLDQNGDFIDTVHFPDTAEKYRFTGKGIYLLKGKVIEDYDFISLEVMEMERLPYAPFVAEK